jgi:carboxymethylenebutenolidase
MCDDNHKGLVPYTDLSRRKFSALIAAAAATSVAGCATAQTTSAAVSERAVQVRTPDGVCDAALFLPAARSAPGVLVWPDAGGLRQSLKDMGKRLAGQGYVALVVNPYYRSGDAPSLVAPPGPQDDAQRAKRAAMRAAMTDEAVVRDALAFVAYLDALPETSNAKVGVQGYCMGGPLSFRTAAALPNRIGAVGSFHGGGLTTQNPNSPHLLIAKTNARYLVAIAKNDDANDPASKVTLRETFDKAGRSAIVDVYGGNHGWCVPDSSSYVATEAERAWAALGDLYKQALV